MPETTVTRTKTRIMETTQVAWIGDYSVLRAKVVDRRARTSRTMYYVFNTVSGKPVTTPTPYRDAATQAALRLSTYMEW